MITLGLIGCGARGFVFADYITRRQDCRLAAVCDTDRQRVDVFRQLAQVQCAAYYDYRDLLRHPALDAVIIATPDYAQAEILCAAVQRGIATLCEKPIVRTLAELNEVQQIIDKYRDVVCDTPLVLRQHRLYSRVKELVPRPGSMQFAVIHDSVSGGFYFRRWHRLHVKCGGIVLHEGIHSLNIAMQVMKSRPRRVSAMGTLQVYTPRIGAADRCLHCSLAPECPEYFDYFADRLHPLYETPSMQEGFPRDLCVFNSTKDIPDKCVASIEFDNGSLMTYTLCLFSKRRTREMEFISDQGSIWSDEEKGHILSWQETGTPPVEEFVETAPSRFGGADEMAFDEFLRRVMSGKPDTPGFQLALDTAALALAIETSIRSEANVWIEYSRSRTYAFSKTK